MWQVVATNRMASLGMQVRDSFDEDAMGFSLGACAMPHKRQGNRQQVRSKAGGHASYMLHAQAAWF